MLAFVGIFLFVLVILCIIGWLWGSHRPLTRAGSRPADGPSGGFATPAQLHRVLSVDAVERAGAQVRPGLVGQRPALDRDRKRRGVLTRGRG